MESLGHTIDTLQAKLAKEEQEVRLAKDAAARECRENLDEGAGDQSTKDDTRSARVCVS